VFIARAAYTSILNIFIEYPLKRPLIVESFLNLLIDPLFNRACCIATILAHFADLLKFWRDRINVEVEKDHKQGAGALENKAAHVSVSVSTSSTSSKLYYPHTQSKQWCHWKERADAIGLMCLTHSNTAVRQQALSVIQCVRSIHRTWFKARGQAVPTPDSRNPSSICCVADIILSNGDEIMREGMEQCLSASEKAEDSSAVNREKTHGKHVPNLENILLNYSTFVPHCVAKLGRLCVFFGLRASMSITRKMVLCKVKAMSSNNNIPLTVHADEKKNVRLDEWNNLHALYFSIVGINTDAKIASATSGLSLPANASLTKMQGDLQDYMRSFWMYLTTEVSWVKSALIVAVLETHTDTILMVVRDLLRTYRQLAKKKRKKALPLVTEILFRLALTAEFLRHIKSAHGTETLAM